MSAQSERRTIYRQDYQAPPFTTVQVDLRFELDPVETIVSSTLSLVRLRGDQNETDLWLDGNDCELVSVAIDGRVLGPEVYEVAANGLRISSVPKRCSLEIKSRVSPASNTQLMGLYLSNGNYCTQCEAEGFRRITFFQDRPDVMARYRVRIEADKKTCPVLLSNGNPTKAGDLPEGRHFAEWEDPFPKPSYLFALVAGDLDLLEDTFKTTSGREVKLHIYSERENIDQCGHAMESLKTSMTWDEQRFGLEYDLDLYQIVAISDFNMGAMENKGLNIFNNSATLAKQETATDQDFLSVERIIAHEYFHNWTGNRVTCRDWFQLTLKEGLTVFRDQLFSADTHSQGVKRISDVALLREGQFAEDSGPLAHPIRPDSYIEINNFYTRTVYDKGAEVIRMIHTLLGEDKFQEGMKIYFARHDGQAVTCDDFVDAMQEGSGVDLEQFRRWYSQAGTPVVTVGREYNANEQTFRLRFRQTTPMTPGQTDKEALHIPLRVGLLSRDGEPVPLQIQGENADGPLERLIELRSAEETITFANVESKPIPSLLRGFSAPVRIEIDISDQELTILLGHDVDDFSRWEAGQQLAMRLLLRRIANTGQPARSEDPLVQGFRQVLEQPIADPAFLARLCALPSKGYLAQQMSIIDVEGIDRARKHYRELLGAELCEIWRRIYAEYLDLGDFSQTTEAMGRRALKNVALQYLLWADSARFEALAEKQYRASSNMTDRIGALNAVTRSTASIADRMLADFYEKWKSEPLVVNKWFTIQATMEDDDSVARVRRLCDHPAFNAENPNRLRSLIGAFAMGNMMGFHRPDGDGYTFIVDAVLDIDRRNPQVAARLLTSLGRWRRHDTNRQTLMRAQLERVLDAPALS
ncbi:MAG: aminopeptidase N, partial [Pseudomonadota bacterium]